MVMQRTFAALGTLMMVALAVSGCLEDSESPYAQGAVGDFKYEYLQAKEYKNLVIELDYVTGNNVDSQAKSLLNQRINEVTDKQDITWKSNSFTSSKDVYTLQDLLDLEEKHRTEYKSGNTAVLHIFYLNGEFDHVDNSVLGVAYTGSSIAIFKDEIEDAAFLFVSPQDIEKAVLVHEFGHVLGLVNIGYMSDHDHEDPEHENHSNNDESVMYWAVESQNLGNQFSGSVPNEFDDDDLDDLAKLKAGEL